METLIIDIENSKRDFLIEILKEFSFVINIEKIENNEELIYAVEESEEDIKLGNTISHEELKKQIQTWKKY